MPDKNPSRPDESPVKVEHSGEWDNSYRNYVGNTNRRVGLQLPVFGRNTQVHKDIHAYQESKTPSTLEDKALEAAIQRDLKQRGVK